MTAEYGNLLYRNTGSQIQDKLGQAPTRKTPIGLEDPINVAPKVFIELPADMGLFLLRSFRIMIYPAHAVNSHIGATRIQGMNCRFIC